MPKKACLVLKVQVAEKTETAIIFYRKFKNSIGKIVKFPVLIVKYHVKSYVHFYTQRSAKRNLTPNTL